MEERIVIDREGTPYRLVEDGIVRPGDDAGGAKVRLAPLSIHDVCVLEKRPDEVREVPQADLGRILPLYTREFPDFGFLDVAIPTGFEDVSWHNDICPCFVDETREMFLWVDYANTRLREYPSSEHRFAIEKGEPDEENGLQHADNLCKQILLLTNDWSEVVEFLEGFDLSISASPSV